MGAILYRAFRKDLTEKMTSEWNPEIRPKTIRSQKRTFPKVYSKHKGCEAGMFVTPFLKKSKETNLNKGES